MTELTRRLMLSVSGVALLASTAATSAVLFSGAGGAAPPSGPTGLAFNPSTLNLVNLTAGTKLTTATMQGGTLPMSSGTPPTLTGAQAGNLQIANINDAAGTFDIQVKSGATASPLDNWSFGATVTDTNNLTFTSATNAYAVVVPAAPTVVVPNGSVADNAPAGTDVTTITVTGGTGTLNLSDLDSNTNYVINPTTGASSLVQVSNTGPGAIGTQNVNIQAQDTLNFTGSSGSVTITVQDHTLARKLASITITNTSATTQPANFITQMFGHPFKKGDINFAGGEYPQFKIGGTVCKFSIGATRMWKDGVAGASKSLKFASFLVRIPQSILAGNSLTLDVWTNGTAPGASVVGLSDLSSNTNLSVQVTGLSSGGNISGTWVSSLNQGITDNDDVKLYATGDCGQVYRIRQQFMQSGANHGQLECYHYVAILQDASNGFYGCRYLGKITQPWYDVNSPSKSVRIFATVGLYNGASLQRDPWSGRETTSTITCANNNGGSGTAQYTYSGAVPEYGSTQGAYAVQLTNISGLTVPQAGTTYYLCKESGVYWLGLWPWQLLENVNVNALKNDFVTGTATVTYYPYVMHFGSFYTCGTTGAWDFVQGTGSWTPASSLVDQTTRMTMPFAYWRSTTVLPPYNNAYGANTITPVMIYVPNGSGGPSPHGVIQGNGQAGERMDLGPLPNWHAVHFINQLAVDEQNVRVSGLVDAHNSVCFKNSTTLSLPCLNAAGVGHYSGMAEGSVSAATTFVWEPGAGALANGFTAPPEPRLGTFAEQTTDHIAGLSFYPYVFTGEPQFQDTLVERAQNAFLSNAAGINTTSAEYCSGPRNHTIPPGSWNGNVAKTYYANSTGFGAGIRADGWATRDSAACAGVIPDSQYECASYITYFNDNLTNSFKFNNDWLQQVNATYPFAFSIGITPGQNQGRMPIWEYDYVWYASAMAASMAESSDALTYLNFCMKYPAWIYNTFGPTYPTPSTNGWHIGHSYATFRTGNNPTSPLITNAAGWQPQVAWGVSWSSATNLFTAVQAQGGAEEQSNYTPVIGDSIGIFSSPFPTTTTGTMAPFVPYYVVGPVVGKTFQLSATIGGTPLVLTNSNASANLSGSLLWLNAPGNVVPYVDSSNLDYPAASVSGACTYAQAVGATVDAGMLADGQSRVNWGITNGPKASPALIAKYYMQNTF